MLRHSCWRCGPEGGFQLCRSLLMPVCDRISQSVKQLFAIAAIIASDGPPPARRPRRRRRHGHVLRRRPRACTPSSPTSPPTWPGSSASSAPPWSTASTGTPHRGGRGGRRPGPADPARARRPGADVASLLHEVSGIGPPRRASARSGAGSCPACSTAMAERHPAVQVVVRRRHHHLARPPARVRSPRPRPWSTCPSATSDVATEPLFDEDRIVVAPRDHPLAPMRAGRRSPTWPATSCCSSPPGTSFRDELDRGRRRRRREAAGQGGDRRLRLSPRSPSRATARRSCRRPRPGLARRATGGGSRCGGWPARGVGLARRRRGRLSAPARARARTPCGTLVAAEQSGRHNPRGYDQVTCGSEPAPRTTAVRQRERWPSAREHHHHGQPHGRDPRDPDRQRRRRRRAPGASCCPTSGSTTRRS